MNVPVWLRLKKITIEIIFLFLMSYAPATQWRNEVEVLGGVCDKLCYASVLKTSKKHMGRRDCTAQDLHCEMLSLHRICNLIHTEASKGRTHTVYDVDKGSYY